MSHAISRAAVVLVVAFGNGMGGFNQDQYTPVAVSGVTSGATAVSGGYGSACAVISGAAKCWGSNVNFTLGNGGTSSDYSYVPVQATGLSSGTTALAATSTDHVCAVSGGAVSCWGSAGPFLGDGDGTVNQASPVPVVSLP